MCQIIRAADLQHETLEILEEVAFDRLVTLPYARQWEQAWEQDTDDVPDIELLDAA